MATTCRGAVSFLARAAENYEAKVAALLALHKRTETDGVDNAEFAVAERAHAQARRRLLACLQRVRAVVG